MAVKINYTPKKFATLFDCAEPSAQMLEDWGVIVTVSGKAFSLSCAGKSIVQNIPLKEGVINMAKEGTLPDAAKSVVSTLVSKTYKHAADWSKWTHDDPSGIKGEKMVGLDEVFTDPPKAVVTEDPTPTVMSDPTAPEHLGSEMYDLMDAPHLYSPVHGTSSSSRYFAVGFTTEGIKFAARYDDMTLSVRAEGDVKAYESELVTAGFSENYIKTKGTYTSVHFHNLNKVMASRTLAAVLSGTGLTFMNQMPKVEVFAGKGA